MSKPTDGELSDAYKQAAGTLKTCTMVEINASNARGLRAVAELAVERERERVNAAMVKARRALSKLDARAYDLALLCSALDEVVR